MNNKVKIRSVVLLSVVLGVLFALSIFIENNKKEEIKIIELSGNYHLSSDEYLRFTNLDNDEEYGVLNSKIIKDRFEKHPYIKRVDLLLNKNTLTITIIEKNFESLLMTNEKEYLITDESIIIPKLLHTEKIDYPIVNSPNNASTIVEFDNVNCNKDLVVGLKIISAIKIISAKLYNNLSEVNLRNGKDIVLQFSNMDVPVVIGRNKEVEKILLFERMMKKLDYNKIKNSLTYIDLRYSKYVYVGKSNSSASKQESTS